MILDKNNFHKYERSAYKHMTIHIFSFLVQSVVAAKQLPLADTSLSLYYVQTSAQFVPKCPLANNYHICHSFYYLTYTLSKLQKITRLHQAFPEYQKSIDFDLELVIYTTILHKTTQTIYSCEHFLFLSKVCVIRGTLTISFLTSKLSGSPCMHIIKDLLSSLFMYNSISSTSSTQN